MSGASIFMFFFSCDSPIVEHLKNASAFQNAGSNLLNGLLAFSRKMRVVDHNCISMRHDRIFHLKFEYGYISCYLWRRSIDAAVLDKHTLPCDNDRKSYNGFAVLNRTSWRRSTNMQECSNSRTALQTRHARRHLTRHVFRTLFTFHAA
jgi:hypothetical protein